MTAFKKVEASLLALVGLLAALWIIALLPIGPLVRTRERAFESRLHIGTTRDKAGSAAMWTAGSVIYSGAWRQNPGDNTLLEVGFTESFDICVAPYKVYYLRFGDNGRLKEWWTGEHVSGC